MATARLRVVHRLVALPLAAVLAAACGGGMTGVTLPTPSPTPSPGGFGTVAGTAVAGATARSQSARPAGPTVRARALRGRPALVPDQLLVRFRAATPPAAANALHTQAGGGAVRTIPRIDFQVVKLQRGVAMAAALSAYRASPLVEYAEQDGYAYAFAMPTDPQYGSQAWHYGQINLPAAWDVTTGGAVIVAVLDTGLRFTHPEFSSGVTVPGYDFVSYAGNGDGDGQDPDPTDPGCPNVNPGELSHGTHVAGTVAARTNNAADGAGVNWGGVAATRIMPLRVLGQLLPADGGPECGVGTYSDIAQAIVYAADHGAKVINLSLGGGTSTVLNSAISYAVGLGVTIVAAAGNDGCGPIAYPASHSLVIAVGATGNTSPPDRASYSNCGPELDVMAPGGDGTFFVWSPSWSPTTGDVFAGFQGTSMATAHVAGVIALMISRGVTGPSNIQSVLQSTARDLGTNGFDTQTGWGLVRADLAIGAGTGPTRQCAFTGVVSGTTITRESPMAAVSSTGSFTISNAPTGVKSVFVWQDADGGGTVNTGDLYGRTDNVFIYNGQTTSTIVTVQTYGTGSQAGQPVLTVAPGGASSCP
ncbi:MAG: S8 family serine peptidase [Armatimonadota bacterium]|nr:S8 family serine peptidase [Armatimonadota bacterium]MDR7486912.1 S8 family serine peptidase [Armatimonadota bacterium]MDR7534317.1 S8 family serine peptidase [Armatimonadota bacterium]MDR7537487.1 S8 family serine peptidase [Armatimonadota bacterium]